MRFPAQDHLQRTGPIRQTAIITSHGQPSDPDPAEADLVRLCQQVAALLPGWSLFSATLAKPGALDAAADAAGPGTLIYPFFMTDGWFTRTRLPQRLKGHDATFLPPLGTDPALPGLARDRIGGELAQTGWHSGQSRLIVASHGSGKSRNSARDTGRFVTALSAMTSFAEIRTGYIEEPPFLCDVARHAGPQAICLPFFAAAGGHVASDIPRALDRADFTGLRLPPIGTHTAVPQLIASALQRGRTRTATAQADATTPQSKIPSPAPKPPV
ncbi:cobalamin biosynthesis protein CbiX [Rhodobacteraceae bacterium F11138]|nr:cobalamin biosynthesis protein CbiX [Rhodobacteraceae bacterium F11138]